MKLDVPLVSQEAGSYDCGPACVAMMLQHYGVDATIDSLKNEIVMYDGKWKGSFMPQLAQPFLKRGFVVDIVTLDPRFFLYDEELTQEQIRERIEGLQEKKGEVGELAKLMLTFLDAGGTFKIAIPKKTHLEQALKEGNPVCALLTTRIMTANSPGYNQHFVVVKELKKDEVTFLDPVKDTPGYEGGECTHPITAFLYGVHACAAQELDTGCFMIVKKNG